MRDQLKKAGFKKQTSRQLTPFLKGMAPDSCLVDDLTRTAISIEQALIRIGAKPGKEYCRMDLLRLATPLVISQREKK